MGVAAGAASLQSIAETVVTSKRTAPRVLREDLDMKSLGQLARQNLSEKLRRAQIRTELLAQLDSREGSVGIIVFSDETTIRCSSTTIVTRNARTWAPKN